MEWFVNFLSERTGTILLVLVGILVIVYAIGYATYDENKEIAKITYVKPSEIENYTWKTIKTKITPIKKSNKDSGFDFIESDVCAAAGGPTSCSWSIFTYNDVYETKEKIKVAVPNRLKRGVNPFPYPPEDVKLCRDVTISVVGKVKWDKREYEEVPDKYYPKSSISDLPAQKQGKNVVLFIEKIIGNPQPCLTE